MKFIINNKNTEAAGLARDSECCQSQRQGGSRSRHRIKERRDEIRKSRDKIWERQKVSPLLLCFFPEKP